MGRQKEENRQSRAAKNSDLHVPPLNRNYV